MVLKPYWSFLSLAASLLFKPKIYDKIWLKHISISKSNASSITAKPPVHQTEVWRELDAVVDSEGGMKLLCKWAIYLKQQIFSIISNGFQPWR